MYFDMFAVAVAGWLWLALAGSGWLWLAAWLGGGWLVGWLVAGSCCRTGEVADLDLDLD